MPYEAKEFGELLGTDGFSDELLNTHFKLYQGYVANTNKVIELLEKQEAGSPQYAELKRRFGWEFNGMRLHALYFGSMVKGGSGLNNESDLAKMIETEFGSIENWERDFRATGSLRGIGWAILYYDKCGKRLFNMWINEHDVGHPAGCKPLLVMDVFEHAFIIDYKMNRSDYINSFMNAINWEKVTKRFEKAGVCSMQK
jgi:Fe-Mn family superoxide dismutase